MGMDKAIEYFKKADEAYSRWIYATAIKFYEKAIQEEPQLFPAHLNLGSCLRDSGNIKGAIKKFREALKIDPDNVVGIINLGITLYDDHQLEESLSYCEQALRSQGGDAVELSANFTIGNILEKSGHRQAAMDHYKRALEIDPNYTRVWNGVGAILTTQGRYDEALECFSKAIEGEPDLAEAHINRGLIQMAQGKLVEGMKEAEWRLVMPDSTVGKHMRKSGTPRWRGERIKGKTIVVYCEQGLGDTIFHARYLPQLIERGAFVVFVCQKELVRLMESSLPFVKVVPWGTQVEKILRVDFQVSLLSIPSITKEPQVVSDAYLMVDSKLVDEWALKLDSNLMRVALVWKGNTKFKHEKERGFPFKTYEQMIDSLAGVVMFYGVQKGIPAYEAKGIRSLHQEIRDLADTAAILKNMDVLITSDTSVAHLAGALGVETFMLVQKFPEWRLYGDFTTSPWYPSMTLFRQEKHGDWSKPMEDVVVSLVKKEVETP